MWCLPFFLLQFPAGKSAAKTAVLANAFEDSGDTQVLMQALSPPVMKVLTPALLGLQMPLFALTVL